MSLKTRIHTVFLALFLLAAPSAVPGPEAAVPGLPLLEEFSSTELRDGTRTFADWSTAEQALLFGPRARRFGAFGPATVVSNIGADAVSTGAAVLGDVDGDGDLDMVAGNFSFTEPDRLYLNNGTADPWNGVVGIDISSDLRQTSSVALGDVDGDGDLDLVNGNDDGLGGVNLLYLNNGSADPWASVTGTTITVDTDETSEIVLADMDGDGDLDLVVGNAVNQFEPGDGANRLYLNNGTADPFGGVSGLDIGADLDETTAIAVGDLDGDGDLDVVAGNFEQPNRLYLNNGSADPFGGVTGIDIDESRLFRALAGVVVTTVRVWPELTRRKRSRATPSLGRSGRLEQGNIVRDCEWKENYGWRPVQRAEDVDYLQAHPGTTVQFRLLRDGKAKYVLEMNAEQWRAALGDYFEGSSWRRNGYIVAITRRVSGQYTEEFQDRWASYVRPGLPE